MKYIDNTFFTNEDMTSCFVNTYSKSKYGWEKKENTIEFSTDFIAAPRIAYAKKDDKFIFDLGRDGLVEFLKENYPDDYLKEELEDKYSSLAKSVRDDYLYKHVNYIENWSKVVIHSDGSFEKTDYDLNLFSVDLKDSYDILHQLLIKYKKLIKEYLENDQFIPTLTGGMDTRYLSALWRYEIDEYNINKFYITNIKNDGKNHILLGEADVSCAVEVGTRLGINEHTDIKIGKITLSGMYNLNSSAKRYLNDPLFVTEFIQHGSRGTYELRPFADDLFLMIKHPRKKVFRCLMMLLLAPDLKDLPLIGTQGLFEKCNGQPYIFEEQYSEYMEEAQSILDYWGPEKCKNILKDDEELDA